MSRSSREAKTDKAREHAPLGVEFHRTSSGAVFAQYPSGAIYQVTRQGWRRVPDSVLAMAKAAAEEAARKSEEVA